jgi:hypothetical protein
MFTPNSLLLLVNEYSARLDRALGKCSRDYNILIEAIMNAHNGIIQPHIVTPSQIMNQTKLNQAVIASDLSLPIPFSAAYHNVVLRI